MIHTNRMQLTLIEIQNPKLKGILAEIASHGHALTQGCLFNCAAGGGDCWACQLSVPGNDAIKRKNVGESVGENH